VWPFAEQRRDQIRAHWGQCVKKNPALWNGKLMLSNSLKVSGDCLSAQALEIDYASYTAWRDWGYPDKTHFNIFGSALIRSCEGYLIFGRMAAHTAGAGLTYPPAGALEVADGNEEGGLDVFASALRELGEETGLDIKGARRGEDFAAWCGQMISVTRVFDFNLGAAALVDAITGFIATQDQPELSEVVVLRSMQDVDRLNTEPYAIAIASYLLDEDRC
jgi:8-oxo-dGTP pyrophosphatase MutT (NUDIX family)